MSERAARSAAGAVRVRPATGADHAAVHALNQAAVPAMNPVGPGFFDDVAGGAAAFLVAEEEESGDVVAFLLALPPGIGYDSPNYRWFAERLDGFVYVDRVAVAAERRGRGIGRALYEALDAALPAPPPPVCCEVNLRPPNPGSLDFHEHMGFRVVGEQDTEGGSKRVALMVRPPRSPS